MAEKSSTPVTDTTVVEAAKPAKATGKQASTIIDETLFNKLHEIRFRQRIDKASDLYRAALTAYVEAYEAENGTVEL